MEINARASSCRRALESKLRAAFRALKRDMPSASVRFDLEQCAFGDRDNPPVGTLAWHMQCRDRQMGLYRHRRPSAPRRLSPRSGFA